MYQSLPKEKGPVGILSKQPTPMTYKPFTTFLAAICLVFNFAHAQTSETRFMAGLSGIFLDYQGPLTGDYTQIRSFDPGITVGAHAYLSPFLNLSINSSFIPEATYPLSADNFLSTSLIDVNSLIRFKFNNDRMMREDALIAPYIGTGFGLNTASNNIRLYVPAAVGFQFQVSKNFSLQFETTYKQGFAKNQYQPLTHTAGFIFALSENKKVNPDPKDDKKPPKEKKQDLEVLADSDGDGVPDRDDICPDVKGKRMYLGCPEEEEDPIAQAPSPDPNPGAQPMTDPVPGNQQTLTPDPTPTTIIPPVDPSDLTFLEDAMSRVYFEKGSDELKYESLAVLDTVAMIMDRNPLYDLEVLGHTDNTGSQNENLILSIKRAFKVKYYLVYEKEIRMGRITSDGYSSAAPISDNATAEGRARNRRVEFKMTPSKRR